MKNNLTTFFFKKNDSLWNQYKFLQFPYGLNKKIIIFLSLLKNESIFICKYRLKAYKKWINLIQPKWSSLILPELNLNKLVIYSKPSKKILKNMDYLLKFSKIIKNIKNNPVAIDTVINSKSIGTTFKNKLAKYGIIFCSISEGFKLYPMLLFKFLGSVVPIEDNFFSALNSAIFSDGSFCYIPKNVNCPLDLSTYFRINDQNSGQFERTLIIGETNSKVSYFEGCTAIKHYKNQIHAAIVEIILFQKATINYATFQNWYKGSYFGTGGILNLVTKRGICLGNKSSLIWTQQEIGSAITWKYPSTLLVGKFSKSEFYSATYTSNFQQTDTGTKMIHIGEKTISKILSKGVSLHNSKNTYRALVKFTKKAYCSKNISQCDSLLQGCFARAIAYPHIIIKNSCSKLEHEAKISQFGDEQLFFLQQRGINFDLAFSLIIGNFFMEALKNLPIDFKNENQFIIK